MVLRALKFGWRRFRLARNHIACQCAVPTFTAGARSGVWTVCPDGLGPDSIVYSFGVGDNIAWELALIERFGLTVHAFDPTPASVAWLSGQTQPDRLHFHALGIADRDGTCFFHLPPRGSRFNYFPSMRRTGAEDVELPVQRLPTIMAELGHQRMDVLKIDIEGAEYAVLAGLLAAGIPATQLLVEFHHHLPGVGLGATLRAVRDLNQVGYRIFDISERGLEFSFLRSG
jgi:FkbM family methyltransferase